HGTSSNLDERTVYVSSGPSVFVPALPTNYLRRGNVSIGAGGQESGAEVRDQRSEIRGQRSEIRDQRSGISGASPIVSRTPYPARAPNPPGAVESARWPTRQLRGRPDQRPCGPVPVRAAPTDRRYCPARWPRFATGRSAARDTGLCV